MTRLRVAVLLATVFFASITPVVSSEADGPVALRSADVSPIDAPSVQAVVYMDKLMRERTGGRLSIESFGQNNKDSESYTVDQVRNGMIDMARINIAVLGRAVPSTSILSLPYLFRSRAHMRLVLDGPIGDELLANMERNGLIGLCFYDAGAHSFYSKMPTRSAADMKGLTVHVPISETSATIVRALGAEPVPMPYSRVKAALQAGAIDASDDT